jgi:hypothetical protein
MPNLSPNDDDIFEDYVEQRETQVEDISTSTNPVDKVFSEVDSPFKALLNQTSLKVNFGEAFYSAAHSWIMNGYRQANIASIIDELNHLTEGKFLYRSRLFFCRESIARKKVILRFLQILLDDSSVSAVIREASRDFNINFTETYFHMFFRSFYNIQKHTFFQEIALYKVLCEITDTPVDEDLIDLTKDNEEITDITQYINSLYDNQFNSDDIQQRADAYFHEMVSKK